MSQTENNTDLSNGNSLPAKNEERRLFLLPVLSKSELDLLRVCILQVRNSPRSAEDLINLNRYLLNFSLDVTDLPLYSNIPFPNFEMLSEIINSVPNIGNVKDKIEKGE